MALPFLCSFLFYHFSVEPRAPVLPPRREAIGSAFPLLVCLDGDLVHLEFRDVDVAALDAGLDDCLRLLGALGRHLECVADVDVEAHRLAALLRSGLVWFAVDESD